MVRRDLRGWLAAAGFVLVVLALAAIALSRVGDLEVMAGRWDLVSVETPEGTFVPAGDDDWIEFDGRMFEGRMKCVDFEGEFVVSSAGEFNLGGWGSSGGCLDMAGTGYAFDHYFGHVSRVRLGSELVLESSDGLVKFVFTRPA